MSNLFDYLTWRNDLTFSKVPCCAVDTLICSCLSYLRLQPVFAKQDMLYVKRASEIIRAINPEEIHFRVKEDLQLLHKMAEGNRYGNVILCGYVDHLDPSMEKQFYALTCLLEDDVMLITYRGTDNTLVGWKEDFNMTFLDTIPSQKEAVQYLETMAIAYPDRRIILCGHSKGGNLSVYASVKCDRNIQKRIVKVYSNDGPGFSEEMIQSKEYQWMLPKIKTILPESSIVGMLLEHQEKFEVVKSSQSGIQQHDAMSWEVLGSHFVYVEEVAPQSILLDETMKKWIFQLTKEQREEIVDTVFSMLDDAKIYTVDDFYNSKWKKVQELMKAKSKLSPETQELFSQALRMLWKTGNQTVKKSVKQAVLEKVEEANSLFSTDKSKKSMKSSKK